MSDFADALLGAAALMLIIEGLLPLINPAGWRRIFEQALQLDDGQIRMIGLLSVALGLLLLNLWH